MATKTIYYVRHGEAEANAAGRLAGSTDDSPLTDKGRIQALETAKELKGKPIDLIASSPLRRAWVTAEIIAKYLDYQGDIVKAPLAIERNFGNASGKLKAEAFEMLDNGTVEGAESIDELHKRMERLLGWLRILPAQHILLVAHGGSGMMLRTVVEGGDPHTFHKGEQHANGAIYEFTLE